MKDEIGSFTLFKPRDDQQGFSFHVLVMPLLYIYTLEGRWILLIHSPSYSTSSNLATLQLLPL